MFEKFPKIRYDLPEEYKKIYKLHYEKNRNGDTKATSISRKMEEWMHKKVAEDVISGTNLKTLEIGAGTLNQLKYESSNIGIYDVIEPFVDLYESVADKNKVSNFYVDIQDVPEDSRYDRITSIACFEHILDLPTVVAHTGLLLEEFGNLRVGIPSEGTILWGLGWRLTTGIEYRCKYGLDYSRLMKYEHVNTAKEIEEVLRYFFEDVQVSVFGISKSLSFYQFISCKRPNKERCQKYLNSRS